ncbi:MAG: hypothetical protein IPM91_04475 [Bacteroidetes bacterium]|nr:hypothetical protein [Bacteroidota bacterium]
MRNAFEELNPKDEILLYKISFPKNGHQYSKWKLSSSILAPVLFHIVDAFKMKAQTPLLQVEFAFHFCDEPFLDARFR